MKLTDAQGGYEFTDLQPGQYTLSAAYTDKFVRSWWTPSGMALLETDAAQIPVAVNDVLAGMDLILGHRSRLSGTVLDHFGHPEHYASVSAICKDNCTTGCSLGGTDVNGFWESTDCQPGTYTFEASASATASVEGNAFWSSNGSTTNGNLAEAVQVTSDQDIELNFKLPGTGTVFWSVKDDSGHSIPYPGIAIAGQCSCNLQPFDGGQFGGGAWGLETGYYTISASAPGYLTEYWTSSGGTADPAQAEPVRICPLRETHISFDLPADPFGTATTTAIPSPTGSASELAVPQGSTAPCPPPDKFTRFAFLTQAAAAGSNQLSESEAAIFQKGQEVLISGPDDHQEVVEVSTATFGTPAAQPQGHTAPGYVTLVSPLQYSHSMGDIATLIFDGDVNCDGARDMLDVISLLSGLAHSSRPVPSGCPGIGDPNSVGTLFGDVDCNNAISSADVLSLLGWYADLPVDMPLFCGG